MSKADDFKRELRDLMDKYDACIDFSYDECTGDYGLWGEHFVLTLEGEHQTRLCEYDDLNAEGLAKPARQEEYENE